MPVARARSCWSTPAGSRGAWGGPSQAPRPGSDLVFCAGTWGDEKGLGCTRTRRGTRTRRSGGPSKPATVSSRTRASWLSRTARPAVLSRTARPAVLSRTARPAVRIHRARRNAKPPGSLSWAGVAWRLAGLWCFGEPGVQPFPDLLRGVAAAATFGAGDHYPGGGDAREGRQPQHFPPAHLPRLDRA